MLKKTLLLFLLLLVVLNFNCFSEEKNENSAGVGFSLWNYGYTRTSNIRGGFYFRFTVSLITEAFLFDLNYDTNILTDIFEDHIISASVNARLVNPLIIGHSLIGVSYLCDVTDIDDAHYIGISVTPLSFSTWEFNFFINSIILNLFPITVYYGITTNEFLLSITFFEMKWYL
jgi:hypothetical protein